MKTGRKLINKIEKNQAFFEKIEQFLGFSLKFQILNFIQKTDQFFWFSQKPVGIIFPLHIDKSIPNQR
jgi:hypothetical protein